VSAAVALRNWLSDTWTLSIAPRLPVLLPWSWAYACYRTIARSGTVFRAPSEAAAAMAPTCLPIPDMNTFMSDVCTTWLLDTADLYRSQGQPVDWLPTDVEIRGAWPTSGGFLAVTFHYGTGLWLCRSLRRSGHRSVFVSSRFERDEFVRHPRRYRYGTRRLAEVERISGEPIAYRPGVRQSLLASLGRGNVVIGLIDVPPRLAPHGQRRVRLLDHAASLPDGLLRLAAEAGVPFVPCWVDIDFATGRRTIVIGEACAPDPVDAAMAALAADLERLIRTRPAAWMFWQEWAGWIRDASAFSNQDTAGRLAEPDPATGNMR
jgi:lauroyl/myristoyl acyltransferase